MKASSLQSRFTPWLLPALGLVLAAATHLPMNAQESEEREAVIGRLTRYEVKPADQHNFQRALTGYVLQALDEPANIQAEAYHERDNRSVLWLIERWKNRAELERFALRPPSRVLEALQNKALQTKPTVYHVSDLEPISREQWRRPARTEDQPLTVMLFVDAKPGTQDEFKARYHVAMPQFRGEPGVVTYQLSQFENDRTKFVTYEKFRSDAAFDYHLKFPAVNPIIDYLNSSIVQQPFQAGLHILIEFAPVSREG